jgi:aquaporin Z
LEVVMMKKLAAEFLGTAWLVLCGCGTAVIAAAVPGVGVGLLGVALAFGLSVLTMAYAVGRISGGHFNPAVTVGLAVARRIPSSDVAPYIAAQVAGAVLGAAVLLVMASGLPGFDLEHTGLAANGFGPHSPGGYSALAGLVTEAVLTFYFVLVILGCTEEGAPAGLAAIPIGLALTLIHLVSIPVTNTSVNPARSTGPALFVGGWALAQLWMFWLAPLGGAVIAGALHRWLQGAVTPSVHGDRHGEPVPGSVASVGAGH